MEIIWSPQAQQDLEDAFDYILEDSPNSAVLVYQRIKEQVELLASQPHIGRAGRVAKTRELVIANTPYIVPYRVNRNRLEILRVYHSARRWPSGFE